MTIIDFHVHPLPMISSNELLNEMNNSKVDKAVLLSMDLDPELLQSKKLKRDIAKSFEYTAFFDIEPIYKGMENLLTLAHTPMNHVSELVKHNPDKFIGFGSLHIGYKSKKYVKKKLREIKFFKEEFGFKGIKLLPTLQFFDPKGSNLPLVFKFAKKEDMIILYHTGCDPGPWELPLLSKHGNPQLIEPLVKRYNSPVVLAHMGSYSSMYPKIWYEEAFKLIKENENVFGDLSAVPYLMNQQKIVLSLREQKMFPKILYGSDFPVTSAGATQGMVTAFEIVNDSEYLNEEEKELIFFLNSANLLRI